MDINYIAVVDPDEQPIEYTITHASSNGDDDTIYFYANRNRNADSDSGKWTPEATPQDGGGEYVGDGVAVLSQGE